MNLQTQIISLLLGGVPWHAEHNYHQAQSAALFVPLGVSTDICLHFRHGREHSCCLWKQPKLLQCKELPQWRCWGCPGSINLTLGSTVNLLVNLRPNLSEPGPCEWSEGQEYSHISMSLCSKLCSFRRGKCPFCFWTWTQCQPVIQWSYKGSSLGSLCPCALVWVNSDGTLALFNCFDQARGDFII